MSQYSGTCHVRGSSRAWPRAALIAWLSAGTNTFAPTPTVMPRSVLRRTVTQHVVRPQPGLEMNDGDVELGGGQRARESRVHISDHHHGVGMLGNEQLLEPHHRRSCQHGVRATAYAKRPGGLGNLQIREECVRHGRVVMLPGVRQIGLDACLLERRHQRADLHEVRAGTDNDDESPDVGLPRDDTQACISAPTTTSRRRRYPGPPCRGRRPPRAGGPRRGSTGSPSRQARLVLRTS